MDFENERQLVTAEWLAFMAQQTACPPTTPIDYNNIQFSQPVNGAWMRFNIVPVNTIGPAVGGQMTRTTGMIAIQIFTPGQGGTKLNRQIADAIANYFTFKAIPVARGWLHFQTSPAEDYGHQDGFYQMNVNVSFWRDTRLDLPPPVDA